MRLYSLEMEGAIIKAQNDRGLVWWAGVLPQMQKPPSFDEFTGRTPDKSEALRKWAMAWDKVDGSLRRGKENG
ncbi:MAG: hypothetical protein U5K75_06245 [Ahrensia sp.]|nr:hypothetical protein [Ahrensia sp.]